MATSQCKLMFITEEENIICEDNISPFKIINKPGVKKLSDFGPSIIINTQKAEILDTEFFYNTSISSSDFDKEYIYYGDTIFILKQDRLKVFEAEKEQIIENIRKSSWNMITMFYI